MEIVIDTNIWMSACVYCSLNSMGFINNFMQTQMDMLAVDCEYIMLNEYNDNLSNNSFFQTYINELHKQQRISYGSARITNAHARGLDQVGFHELEDRVFLGRAYNGDKYLVTEDSDYGLGPDSEKNAAHVTSKDYIESIMGVKLVDSATARTESVARMAL